MLDDSFVMDSGLLTYFMLSIKSLTVGFLIRHLMLSLELLQNSETYKLNGFVTFTINIKSFIDYCHLETLNDLQCQIVKTNLASHSNLCSLIDFKLHSLVKMKLRNMRYIINILIFKKYFVFSGVLSFRNVKLSDMHACKINTFLYAFHGCKSI